MQDEVNKIIFNALTAGREVWLPGIGWLVLESRRAWRSSARQLEKPRRRVVFLSESKGVSLVDLIAQAGGCDATLAQDIYDRWLEKVRTEDGLSIAGVGILQHKYFTIDSHLDALLNPLGHDPVALKPRSSRMLLFLVVVLLCMGAAGAASWWMWEAGWISFSGISRQPETLVETRIPDRMPAAEQPVVPELPDSLTLAEYGAESTSVKSQAAVASADGVSAGVSAENPVAKSGEGLNSATENEPLEVARMISGRTYVILGVFSTEQNARRAVTEANVRAPRTSLRLYHFGAKWAVSAFENDSAAECRTYMNNAGSDLNGAWPYTKK